MKKTANQLGRELGINSRKVNELLKEIGYLAGDPGKYILTEMGKKFAEIAKKDNGYGGYAARKWEFRKWNPEILDELRKALKKNTTL